MSTPQRSRWLTWRSENNADAQEGGLPKLPKAPAQSQPDPFGSFDSAGPCASPYISRGDPDRPKPQPDTEPGAVRLINTVAGDVWVVLDATLLAANPDILDGELPVFFADELAALAGHPVEDLRLIAAVKRTFPGARIVQDTAAGIGQRAA